MDVIACNYNENATDDDGCDYAEEFYDCEGLCLYDSDEDSICNELEVIGCMDINACNYYENVTDEGDCDGLCMSEIVEDDIYDELDVNYNVEDIEDNIYETIIIGDQEWMTENLKTTHYQNGDSITHIAFEGGWEFTTSGAYGDYDNNPKNSGTYGKRYNWYAVGDGRGDCPAGWQVPTDNEFNELEMYLVMSQTEADNTGWRGTNEGSKLGGYAVLWDVGELEDNNVFGASGFTAIPPGHHGGFYLGISRDGYFWLSSEVGSFDAWKRWLN